MGELYNPFPKLPKNIRQMGESDPIVRLYMEDYVSTYLKRLYPSGNQTMRVGLLLGNVEYHEGIPYIFVDGAMEMEEVETDGEKVLLSETIWKKAYQRIEDTFPKRTIQGWFLCGNSGSQLSPLNYWKQHGQYFAGKNQLMYLNHGLEGDESVYIASEDGFYQLKGHCIYYERNQMMQVSVRNRTLNAMGMLCGVLAVAVLAGGVALVNNYTKMQKMESVLASVLPANVESWDKYQKMQEEEFVIEEVAGKVFPTEPITKETDETMIAETMTGEKEETLILSTEQENISLNPEETTPEFVGMDKGEGQGDSFESQIAKIDYEAAAANGYRIYTVGEGETLYGICWKQYNGLEHLTEICRLNQLKNVDRILAGQKLILP